MENRKFLRVTTLLIMTFVFLFTSSCSGGQQWILFNDKEIKGSVVDAETGKPIEGAIVIGMWALTQIPGEGFGGYAKIQVEITDKEGKFTIPSWTTFKPWKLLSVTHGLAPKIVIYKPGYKLYWSHKVVREGYPDHYEITAEEKQRIKEAASLNPAKLKRIYTDEEIWENHKEFRSQANFPDTSYSKQQLKVLFDALQSNALKLPTNFSLSQGKLLKDINEDREFYLGGKK